MTGLFRSCRKTVSTTFAIPVSALAFDVDGTIADTDPVHAQAWLQAFQNVTGREGFSVDDYITQCILGAMSPEAFISPLVSAGEWPIVQTEKRKLYPIFLARGVKLAAGLNDFVSSAQAAQVRIAIVSSSSRASVDALLDHAWQAAPPDVVICRGDAASSKPSPAPYSKALELLNLEPNRVVAFEDADAGIRSAQAAGLKCVQIGSKISSLADVHVDSFLDCRVSERSGQACLMM